MMRFEQQAGYLLSRSSEKKETAGDGETLTSAERTAIEARAELRRGGQAFKVSVLNLERPKTNEALQKAHDKMLARVFREVKGDGGAVRGRASREEVVQEVAVLKQKGREKEDVLPRYAAFLFAQAAQLEESIGEDMAETLSLAGACLARSDTKPGTAGDILPQAMLLGIRARQVVALPLPEKQKVAEGAIIDSKLLAEYALILSETERAEFLDLIPAEKRRTVSLLLDAAVVPILKDSQVLDEDEKTQKGAVQKRLENGLREYFGHEAAESKVVIRVISQALAALGDEEGKNFLQRMAKENIGKNAKNEISYVSRIVKELTDSDEVSGSSLTMEFLGKADLPEKYRSYFFEKIYHSGFLAKNLDQASLWSDEQCQVLLRHLQQHEEEWQDEVNISGPFKRGAEKFGIRKMFQYAGRPDVSRHDALFGFDKVMRLQAASGLSAERFFGSILKQVYDDGSTYESGSSYAEMNAIANSLDLSDSRFSQMQMDIDRYGEIAELKSLGEYLQKKEKIFASWSSLKKFVDLSRLLEQAEILEELQELEREAKTDPKKARLAKFVKTLAFHPDSKVNMQAVLKFWREPGEFLDEMDGHTPNEVQNSKKPSNYTEIPNLDLTAVELRDALVDGTLDRLQAFPSMEIIYTAKEEKLTEDKGFIEAVQYAVGRRDDNTINKPLFEAVRKLCRTAGVDAVAFLRGDESALSGMNALARKQMEVEVREAMEQFPNTQRKQEQKFLTRRYRSRINLKSDPQAVLAGDDTACCMPFGSGKNNIYMWNPGCALFTLEEERGNTWRTIAQSVVTLDQDIRMPVSDLVETLRNNQGNLSEILPKSVLKQDEHVLACDNIEVAPSAQTKTKTIEALYARFFQKYLAFYNQRSKNVLLNTGKVVIGQGHSDIRFGESEPNTFAPVAPVGYSDKLGSRVDVIRFDKRTDAGAVVHEEIMLKQEDRQGRVLPKTGVLPLTFQDSLSVAYLEGKAYTTNTSLITYLHNMENGLIAKDINNVAKGRANMSTKYVDSTGEMRGYMLAYEGRDDGGESVLYVSDLASDRESKLAGGRIIHAFLEKYKTEYVDKGVSMPILLQAREGTSYEIVRDNMTQMSARLGVHMNIEEINTYQVGTETMHELRISSEEKE